jgi:hypothetical protein
MFGERFSLVVPDECASKIQNGQSVVTTCRDKTIQRPSLVQYDLLVRGVSIEIKHPPDLLDPMVEDNPQFRDLYLLKKYNDTIGKLLLPRNCETAPLQAPKHRSQLAMCFEMVLLQILCQPMAISRKWKLFIPSKSDMIQNCEVLQYSQEYN